MWARRHFPEPEAGTGIVESHTQSRECRALDNHASISIPFPEGWKKKKWHACEESATCLETLVRKALPTSTPSGRDLFQFPFVRLDLWIRCFGYIWTNNCKTTIQGQFRLRSYYNANEWCDGTLYSNWEVSPFPILTPQVGEAGLPHPYVQTKWLLGLQPSIDCKVVPSSTNLHADTHGDYKHESNQNLYK